MPLARIKYPDRELHEYPYYGCLNFIAKKKTLPFEHEYPYYGCLNPRNDALPDGLSVHEYPYYGCLNIKSVCGKYDSKNMNTRITGV